ncbi:hypothetical protein O3G_MSEX008132 [Manduca sexta]|uniref:Phosphatidylserine Lipase ABHD16 N-terminal domain-containing protein n=1 Tax=Manduca sexta TaxID=7130 RepID=A0A921Z9K9_MANSE|nr:hypothetical protein O3G_MSEX008132 [Manduca sexta]
MLKLTRQCLFSPRLYRIYGEGLRNVLYEPNKKESFGDKVIISVTTIMNITYYASPFLCMYILKRGFFSYFELKIMGNLLGGIGCFVAFCFALRAYGRASNPKYVRFLRDIKSPSANQQAYLERIRRYDFDFNAWPVNYKVAQCEKPSWALSHPFKSCANADLPVYQRVPLQVLAFFAIHTFGLRLIYPGTLALIQRLIANALISGRTQMVELFNGRRAKVATADGNMIDTMFVDNTAQSAKGKILVVSCEGNSGYYEVGLMSTPVKCGYSALGWNHPGFGWSTVSCQFSLYFSIFKCNISTTLLVVTTFYFTVLGCSIPKSRAKRYRRGDAVCYQRTTVPARRHRPTRLEHWRIHSDLGSSKLPDQGFDLRCNIRRSAVPRSEPDALVMVAPREGSHPHIR